MDQLDLFNQPDTTGMARNTDPETSHGAAAKAAGNKAHGQRLALLALAAAGDHGATDFELADATGWQQTSIGKRRGELRDALLVAAVMTIDPRTGAPRPVKRKSPTNTPAQVWAITAAGREAAASLTTNPNTEQAA